MLESLPHVNAALNGLAALLLVAGYVLIKQRRETAHKWTMMSCFGVSALFLICYLTYHIGIGGGKRFPEETGMVRTFYLGILISHAILAVAVPPLAIVTIYHGWRDNRVQHRRLARWTFPIWLYVSVTGVVVYWMLYQMYGPA
jgi:putative membrane protein